MKKINESFFKNQQESFPKPKNCDDLLTAYKERKERSTGKILRFAEVGDKDVYNVSAPFVVGGKTYMTGRVESPETSKDVLSYFFTKSEGVWQPDLNLPIFKLEDPFVNEIGGEVVLGGVETYPRINDDGTEGVGYKTVFYKGENLQSLKRFSEGPEGMKDIRLIELPNNEIGVFTRPQGEVGGLGRIGFTKLNSLEELDTNNILKAQLIEGQFCETEWGGVNWTCILENGNIGILGHIASQDKTGEKHYFAMSFIFNPETSEASPLKIIAIREDFPKESRGAKRPDLEDVVFPGGLVINSDGTATLYAGLSDALAGCINIPNPYL